MDRAVERGAVLVAVEVLRDLGNAEAAQRDAHQANPVGQEGRIHGEALHAAVDIGTDLPKQHADQAHRHAIEQTAGGDEAHAYEPDQHKGAVVGGPEQECHLAQNRRQPREDHNGDCAPDEAGNTRGEQGEARLPLECHLVAIDTGHDAARVRNLHRDGAHAVAILSTIVDSRQHNERATRGNGIGQRQQYADRGQRTQSRQHADQRADRAADGAEHEVLQGQGVPKPKREVLQNVHQ